MFGYSKESAFAEIVDRNLIDVPAGALKDRILGLRSFLTKFSIKNDPQIEISILTNKVRQSFNDTALSDSTSDMEVLFYLKLILSSSNSNPPETLRYMQQIKSIIENKLLENLSKDPILRKAQEIFICDDIKQFLNGIPMSERPDIANIFNFLAEASKESGDLEFSSSLGILARSLSLPL